MVSIVTPVFNSQKYISECISSVLDQTYKNWEHILVDDCSTDNSAHIIKGFAEKDNRIIYVKLSKNSGAGVARNKAIELAKGNYIAFLDSDDLWTPFKLEKQISFMKTNKHAFSYSDYYVINENFKTPLYLVKAPKKVDFKKMRRNDYIGCLTAIYDVSYFGKKYMPIIRKRQDWVLWLNLLKETDYAYCLNEPLAFYRIGNQSLSSSKFKLLKHNFNVYYIELGYSFVKSIYHIVVFLTFYFHYKLTSKKKIT
ncbi:glycosyltransferase [Flagellimonas marinaquae]|uniref:glycosyltransferase family 2 protein n=1 Tax=Flagellimonas aurea TaxID=2915619 RepID=UPI001CE1EB9A|nr:glycosyltransferase [Allomuricauda aquimarina]